MKRATAHSQVSRPLRFRGQVQPTSGALSSPASGLACVFWQLRIIETVSPTLEFIHELRSPESFFLQEAQSNGNERLLLIRAEATQVSSETTLHPVGSPVALAVAEALEFADNISVEECLLRPAEQVEVSGFLLEADTGAGPGRRVHLPLELCEAEVRVDDCDRRFRLLPWRWRR